MVDAMTAALRRRGWRRMTPQNLARHVVGAADHHSVVGLLVAVPGIDPEAVGCVEPADPDDLRVTFLTRRLTGLPWRRQRLARLCTDLADALRTWHVEREAFTPACASSDL